MTTPPPPAPSAAFPVRPAPQPDDSTPFDAPELRRGLSSTLAKMDDTLRDTHADYVLADNNLLWHAPRSRAYAIAVPKRLVPAV